MASIRKMWQDRTLIGKKVKRRSSVRTVVVIYGDIPGGVRLDRPVDGFKSWNVDDLRMAKRFE